MSSPVRIGVLNISDRASAGVYEDTPGKACVALLREWLTTPFETDYRVIPDEQAMIESELRRLADDSGCCLVVTTGGTGPAARDVTPEATEAVCEKLLPGFGELMRATSLKYVPTAILSRQTAGIRGRPAPRDECDADESVPPRGGLSCTGTRADPLLPEYTCPTQ